MDTVSPDFTRTTEIVLCQISRGVAPVMAIVGAVQAAQKYGWEYLPITGLPLVEAKNHAFFHALEQHRDLVLIEDDILVDDEVWDAIANSIDQVGYARTRMRTGEDNVVTNADGQFMYTGNCLCMIPLPILQRLPRPPFESRKWSPTKDTLDTRPSGLMQNGVGSDTGFWYHVRHLDPAPEIVEVGQVRHLRHEFNIKRDNLTPIACEITEW